MREIRLYIEGGGSEEKTKRPLRAGFHEFFREISKFARREGLSFVPIACGSRESTYKLFSRALEEHREAFNVLLVDADQPVSSSRADHVRNHFQWLWKGCDEDQCHLMVQVMESWFLADPSALQDYYGRDFQPNALPGSKDVETVFKDAVLNALKHASRNTKKGEYHKIKHASELLKRVRPAEVRKASAHCDSLFKTLESKIQAVS